MKRIATITILVLAVAALAVWQIMTWPKWRPIQTNTAISAIEIDGSRIHVRLSDNRRLPDVIDLSVFHGLHPVNDFGRAKAAWGKPDSIKIKGDNFIAYEYWYPKGRVDLECNKTAKTTSWDLCAYPSSMTYSKVVAKEIIKAMATTTNEDTIMIYGKNDEILMICTIEESRVQEMRWPYKSTMKTQTGVSTLSDFYGIVKEKIKAMRITLATHTTHIQKKLFKELF